MYSVERVNSQCREECTLCPQPWDFCAPGHSVRSTGWPLVYLKLLKHVISRNNMIRWTNTLYILGLTSIFSDDCTLKFLQVKCNPTNEKIRLTSPTDLKIGILKKKNGWDKLAKNVYILASLENFTFAKFVKFFRNIITMCIRSFLKWKPGNLQRKWWNDLYFWIYDLLVTDSSSKKTRCCLVVHIRLNG